MAASYNCDKLKTKSRQQQLAVASPTALFTFLFATLPCLSTSDRHELQKKLFTGREVGGREWLNCSRPRGRREGRGLKPCTIGSPRAVSTVFCVAVSFRVEDRPTKFEIRVSERFLISSRLLIINHSISSGRNLYFYFILRTVNFWNFQWANITRNCTK